MSFGINDLDEGLFDFTVKGTLTTEIEVRDEALNEIVHGVGSVDFSSTAVGSPVTKTVTIMKNFTIRTDGEYDLTFRPDSVTVPPGFRLLGPSYYTVIRPGSSASATVLLEATAPDIYGGTLSLPNGDSDKNPFDIEITGSVGSDTQEIAVLDAALVSIDDNTGVVDVGDTLLGSPLAYTFTICNYRQQTLTLNPSSPSWASGTSRSSSIVTPNPTRSRSSDRTAISCPRGLIHPTRSAR